LLREVERRYAGYIAWRGTLEEGAAPTELVRFFDQSFTVCEARSSGHILCYFTPGPGDATEPGQRQLNWVWYVNVPELTGEIHAAAESELHPYFAELVQSTPNPFIQSIFDVVVPRMAFGRACLVGDAAFVLRPHAAGATAKAAADAISLAAALADPSRDPETALQA
jgi:2-polyprenyl-6-methoxyphenol hydroxylase-like FAD-dependent oxidoreductase